MMNCFKINQFGSFMLAEESIIKTTSARHLPTTAGKKAKISGFQ